MKIENPSILVVDDSRLIRRRICDGIDSSGLATVCGEAGDGQEAIEQFRKLCPDIVLLDLQMPVMDGLTALREIIAINPQAIVIVISSHVAEADGVQALSAGAVALVDKSDFEPDTVMTTVNEILTYV